MKEIIEKYRLRSVYTMGKDKAGELWVGEVFNSETIEWLPAYYFDDKCLGDYRKVCGRFESASAQLKEVIEEEIRKATFQEKILTYPFERNSDETRSA